MLLEEPDYHIFSSDKVVLREHSKALLASFENINFPRNLKCSSRVLKEMDGNGTRGRFSG